MAQEDDYPDKISSIKPIVVGDVTTFTNVYDFLDDHDWIPVQLSAGKSYVMHDLYSMTDELYGPATNSGIGIHTEQSLVLLRDSQGRLIFDSGQLYDFAFSAPTSGKYYLDATYIYDFIPSDAYFDWDSYYPSGQDFKITTYTDDYTNNISRTGRLLSPDSHTVSTRGTLEVAGDHDWFKVPLIANKQYFFSATLASVTPDVLASIDIKLYDADQKVLVGVQRSGPLFFTVPTSGNYYVDVSSAIPPKYNFPAFNAIDDSMPFDSTIHNLSAFDISNHTGPYTLTVTQKDDDYGNNPTTAGTSDVYNNSLPTGHLEKQGDHDWLKLTLTAWITYKFGLDAKLANHLTSLHLALHDASGKLITGSNAGGSNPLGFLYHSNKSGTYYLDISGLKNTDVGAYEVTTNEYMDPEPNDLAGVTTLNPIQAGSIITGKVNAYFPDHDWFPVKLDAGRSYYFFNNRDFNNGSPGNLGTNVTIALRDQAGNLTHINPLVNNNVIPEIDLVQGFVASKSGVFYLDFSKKSNNTDKFYGDYNSYALLFGSYLTKDDYTNNASTTGKLALSSNTFVAIKAYAEKTIASVDVSFYDCPWSDADWFKVSLQAQQHYTFALSVTPTAFLSQIDNSLNSSLTLVDAKGNAVKGVTLEDGIPVLSFTAPKNGTYYLNTAVSGNDMGAASILYTLIGQENAPLGTAGNDILTGGAGDDLIWGKAGNDVLTGGAGHDILIGGTGKDTLIGGLGSDVYYVDNTGDKVIETATRATETDTVESTISYTLPAHVENLILAPLSTSKNPLVGNGNALNNTLISSYNSWQAVILHGNAGNDTLIAKSDNVTLYGDQGDDAFKGSGHFIGGLGKDRYEIIDNRRGYPDVSDLFHQEVKYSEISIARGDSLPSSFDVVKGFSLDKDDLNLASKQIAVNTNTTDGKNVGSLDSHHINNGLISFDDAERYTAALSLNDKNLIDAINYVQTNVTKSGDTVAFIVGADTYVFQDGGSVDTLVELVGVNAAGFSSDLWDTADMIYLM